MRKYLVIRDYYNETEVVDQQLTVTNQVFFRTEIQACENRNNICYENGETYWQSCRLFEGELCEIFDSLKLAFENSYLDKTKWNEIIIKSLNEEEKALASAIIAEANA